MIFTLDIGGTYTKYAFVENWRITQKGKWETTQDLPALLKNIDQVLCERPDYIGISSGGFWKTNGVSVGYETIKATSDPSFVKTLKEKYDCKVYIENDARCALLAEREWGVLKNEAHGVLFVLGSSLGCAVLLNGIPLCGITGQAGAMFMMPERFDAAGIVCDQDANSIWLTQAYRGEASAGDMLLLEQKAMSGDSRAQELIATYAKAVALKCWYAYLMYDPACIVLGGGISNSHLIVEKIKAETKKFFKNDISGRTPCFRHTLFGEDSNLLGAALLGNL